MLKFGRKGLQIFNFVKRPISQARCRIDMILYGVWKVGSRKPTSYLFLLSIVLVSSLMQPPLTRNDNILIQISSQEQKVSFLNIKIQISFYPIQCEGLYMIPSGESQKVKNYYRNHAETFWLFLYNYLLHLLF